MFLKRLFRKYFGVSHRVSQTDRPKFRVVEEFTLSGRQRKVGERITINAITRPKQCVLCRTEGKITRLNSGHWKCTECGHTWH